MGVFFVMSPCHCCHRMITYNPHLVPSIPAHLSGTGTKEPVCADCIARANPERLKNGLPPIIVIEGAYEVADEHELGD